MKEWFEEQHFWDKFYPLLFPPERLERGDMEVDNIITLSGIHTGRVLDLCCGPGRHAAAFARRGFEVTAVDLTPFLLEKGKKLAAKESITIEWVQEDMRRFRRPDTFHLAVNLFTSFGFFAEQKENSEVLVNIYQSLKEGGRIVIDAMGKEILARRFQETRSCNLPDGSLFIEKNQIIDSWRRVKNQWLLIKEGQIQEYQFILWIYSAEELAQMLEEAGFCEIQIFGSQEGTDYDENAQRLVLLAKK